ncbi:MAG: GntR family transcriptional regulator [Pseudorhodobacter sp. PARRP1]|nr:MAG: GntR family transcriptional regulator [Pseudorhodobacter sp. PARRP1]
MTKTDQAIDQLQRMIEHGDLKPGSMVSESQLVEITGFGRTPIREAIQRLATARMIRVHPSKGLEIPAISVEDQLCALEVRRPIEVLAVELAAARAAAPQRAAMQDLAATLAGRFGLRDYTETVRRTHAMIIEAAQNPYLSAAMLPLQALSRRFWITYLRDEVAEIARGGALHRQMLSAVAAGDKVAARAASLALNDYLVAHAVAVIARRAAPTSAD